MKGYRWLRHTLKPATRPHTAPHYNTLTTFAQLGRAGGRGAEGRGPHVQPPAVRGAEELLAGSGE